MRARGIQSRLCGVLLYGMAWLFVAPRASAQAGCVEIEGTLPEALSECVTEAQLCSSYLRALAADGGEGALAAQETEADFLPMHVRLSAASAQSADASALELDVAAYGVALGQRTLSVRARDCAAVPDAFALVLALLARQAEADPRLMAAMNAERAQPSAAVEQAPPERRAPEKRAASAVGSSSISAGAGVFFGALPSAAPALQLQAATPLGDPLALRARATLLWPQQQRIAEGSVNMQHYELALEACAGFPFLDTGLSLRLCGGPRSGLMIVHARDFTLQNERAAEFLLYLGVLPELGLTLGPRTSLSLGVAAAAALIRPRFGVALNSGTRVSTLSTPGAIRAELALTLVQIF